ncbi:hypothetical protein PTE31013_01950 [Pandoraea terrigena]|uniref:Uncharacterized protein n=1 Tax=Pandoraea terrigena TaxID=2508292 RepID=A0A5E4UDV1_9BURK|nr:hypothetical protein PTE31013_01950 [Pandoraea terrigena]
MDLQQRVGVRLRGRPVIWRGLLCSFTTCLAGTPLNALFEGSIGMLGSDGLMRRLIVGDAAAAVVVLALPLLSGGPRQLSADDGA